MTACRRDFTDEKLVALMKALIVGEGRPVDEGELALRRAVGAPGPSRARAVRARARGAPGDARRPRRTGLHLEHRGGAIVSGRLCPALFVGGNGRGSQRALVDLDQPPDPFWRVVIADDGAGLGMLGEVSFERFAASRDDRVAEHGRERTWTGRVDVGSALAGFGSPDSGKAFKGGRLGAGVRQRRAGTSRRLRVAPPRGGRCVVASLGAGSRPPRPSLSPPVREVQ